MLSDEELKTQCRQAADMIVDGLIMAGIVDEKNSERAIEIAEEELIVRKALGKF